MDFSEGLLDFLSKKSFLAQKARIDFFRESDGFFRGRIWQFWWIHAHSFPSERWKSHCCDFHRLLGKSPRGRATFMTFSEDSFVASSEQSIANSEKIWCVIQWNGRKNPVPSAVTLEKPKIRTNFRKSPQCDSKTSAPILESPFSLTSTEKAFIMEDWKNPLRASIPTRITTSIRQRVRRGKCWWKNCSSGSGKIVCSCIEPVEVDVISFF